MKNIFRVALLTALACLLCFSCTNINDPETLTADKFTVNKMKVEGFLLEGLNAVYDDCDFTLIREEKSKAKSNLMWKVRKLEKDKVLIENEKIS